MSYNKNRNTGGSQYRSRQNNNSIAKSQSHPQKRNSEIGRPREEMKKPVITGLDEDVLGRTKALDVFGVQELANERFKEINIQSNEWPIEAHIMVHDLSLKAKGHDEDLAFAKDPMLSKNIRRGNTIIEVFDKNDYSKVLKTLYARRGMMKFFDLKHDYVNERRHDEYHLKQEEINLKNYILAPQVNSLKSGHKVEVVKTLKANGENCQVSYNAEAECWVIASKNVALLARDKTDLKEFEKQKRHSFSVIMAQCWFEIISQINIEQGPQAIDALKRELAGRTMIGEYVGNPECQHLVKYQKHTILFYTIVPNQGDMNCLLPEECYAFFNRWGLDKVAVEVLGVYDNFEKLCDDLSKSFVDVSRSSIAQEEEGAVLYFINRDQEDPNKDHVTSLAKLKTLEYRLFRKLREKLRNHVSAYYNGQPTDSNEKIKRFIQEAKILCDGYSLPRPLGWYINIAEFAFETVDKDELIDDLQNYYVTFLEKLLKKRKGSQHKKLFDSHVFDSQDEIDYTKAQGARQGKLSFQGGAQSGKNIVLIAPPHALNKQQIQVLTQQASAGFKVLGEWSIDQFAQPASKNKNMIYHVYEVVDALKCIVQDNTLRFVLFNYTQPSIEEAVKQLSENSRTRGDAEGYESLLELKKDSVLEYLSDFIKENQASLIDAITKSNGINIQKETSIEKLFQTIGNEFGISSIKSTIVQMEVEAPAKAEPKAPVKEEVKVSVKGKNKAEVKAPVKAQTPKSEQKQFQDIKQAFIEQTQDNNQAQTEEIIRKKSVRISDEPEDLLETGPAARLSKVPSKAILKNKDKPVVHIYIPFGIPGMGKSSLVDPLIEYCDQEDIFLQVINADQIRKFHTDKIFNKAKCSYADAFKKSADPAKKQFNKEFSEMLQNVEGPKNVIFVDKNHPPNALKGTVDLIVKNIPQHYNYKMVPILPNCVNKMEDYPFSFGFFFQCLARVLNRSQHDTLDNTDPIHATKIMFMFAKMYQGFDIYRDWNAMFENAEDPIYLPFTYENETMIFPPQLVSEFEYVMKTFNSGTQPRTIQQFYSQMQMWSEIFSSIARPTTPSICTQKALSYAFKPEFPASLPVSPSSHQEMSRNSSRIAFEKVPADEVELKHEYKGHFKDDKSKSAKEIFSQKQVISIEIKTSKTKSLKQVPTYKKKEVTAYVEKVPKEPESYQAKPDSTPQHEEVKVPVKVESIKSQIVEEAKKAVTEAVRSKKGPKAEALIKSQGVPIYLGLNLVDQDDCLHEISDYIMNALQKLQEKNFQVDDAKRLLKSFEKGDIENKDFRFVKNFHMTQLFLGRKGNGTSNKIFRTYEVDEEKEITIEALLYVPKKIITLIAFSEEPTENEYPHITAMLGQWKPIQSNDALTEMMKRDDLYRHYQKLKRGELFGESFVKQTDIQMNDGKQKAYLIKVEDNIKFKCVTRFFYS